MTDESARCYEDDTRLKEFVVLRRPSNNDAAKPLEDDESSKSKMRNTKGVTYYFDD